MTLKNSSRVTDANEHFNPYSGMIIYSEKLTKRHFFLKCCVALCYSRDQKWIR